MNRFKLPIIVLAASALVAAVVGFSTRHESPSTSAAPAAAATASSAATSLQNTFIGVYRKVSPSVVQISTSSGLGSGIVFDGKGDIVTNDHVVSGSTSFVVTTSTGKRLNASLVGEFPADDLAVIHVNGGGLHPATFADSSKLQVGQIAIAIGNPLGLSSSVTEGIVSALNRQESEGNGVATLQNAIQTSAPINPGNSGGALVDIQGRVMGIPTLAASDPQLGSTAAGIGFAIPSNTVTSIASQLIKSGKVTSSNRAFLGVQVADTGAGAYVGVVTAGSPAAKAGIVVGDVITAINGNQTPTIDQLSTVLAAFKPGQKVTVSLTHQNGTSSTVTVTLGDLSSSA
jgi:S1-C subfamily serine protease